MHPCPCPPICWQLRGARGLSTALGSRTVVPIRKGRGCCCVTVLLVFARLAGGELPAALGPGAGCGAEGTRGFASIAWPRSVFTPSF